MTTIAFRLQSLLPTPNRWMRMHWAERGRYCRNLAWEVCASIIGPVPSDPIPAVRVTVVRHGLREPDADALAGCAKPILDVLQPASKRHPYGLGLIAGDDRAHCELVARFVKVRHRTDQCTTVVLEPIP